MNQILAGVTYLAVLGNVFFAAFLAATPADHALPWWVAAIVAGGNALVHALPSDGLPLPAKQVAKASAVICLLAWSLALSGCASLGLTGDPANDVPVITGDLVKVCRDLGPLAAPLAAAPDARVQAAGVVAIYASSVCDGNGNVIAAVIPTLSGDTAAWAKVLLGELQAAQGVTPPVPVKS
jgi:hypothetical protein